MKNRFYSTTMFALFLISVNSVFAQIDPPCMIPGAVLCDNFDAYADGDYLGPQASWWTTWDASEGDASDAEVTDEYAYSGTLSMLVDEGSSTDALLLLGNQTTGVWRLRWMMLVPEGSTGYYNIQESESPGIAWNMEAVFSLYDYVTPAPPGEGTVLIPDIFDFSYPIGEWFMVDHIIDLDADQIELYVDGALVFTYAYAGSIGSINFYSIDAANRYYVDDVLLIDNALMNTYYADTDDDLYGDALNFVAEPGDAPVGYVENADDCDDTNSDIHPGATEICNDIDDNCDDNIDEGVMVTYFVDGDGDTYGSMDGTTEACTLPAGYSENSADCDDTDDAVYPGATEILNGVDDDCDEAIDEDLVSISDEFVSGISVYPVPATNQFTIEFNAMPDSEVSLMIIDQTGRIVFVSENGNESIIHINTTEFSSGVYQVQIIAGDNFAVKQLIIQQ